MSSEVRIATKRSKLASKASKRKKKPVPLPKQLESLQKQICLKVYGNDCYTCAAKNLQGKNCQLGHVPWPRSILATPCKYDLRFVRPQCLVCNVHHGGMGGAAAIRMQAEGVDLDSLWQESKRLKGITYGNKWFKEQITLYEAKLALMK